jgi:hypothetical protein
MAALSFGLNAIVHMSSADNRVVHMRVSKTQGPEATPAIDVIPRVRYRIPCTPYEHRADLQSPLLFEAGLLVVPEVCSSGPVRHVVVCNLGDRIHRLCSGCQVLCPPPPASSGGDGGDGAAQPERLASGSPNLATPEAPG